MLEYLEKVDIRLFCLINKDGQNTLFDYVMPIVSNFNYFIVPLVLWGLFLLRRKPLMVLGVILVVAFSDSLCYFVLKPLLGRPRPFDMLSAVHLYKGSWSITGTVSQVEGLHSLSLPSSHATSVFAASFFLSYYMRPWLPFFYLVALMVAYSRVYIGVHYPFDVLLGAIVGSLMGVLGVRLVRLGSERFQKKRQIHVNGS
ncbi:MAG: phosphatase PAP2 family protein [Desulfobacteria bacterium]